MLLARSRVKLPRNLCAFALAVALCFVSCSKPNDPSPLAPTGSRPIDPSSAAVAAEKLGGLPFKQRPAHEVVPDENFARVYMEKVGDDETRLKIAELLGHLPATRPKWTGGGRAFYSPAEHKVYERGGDFPSGPPRFGIVESAEYRQEEHNARVVGAYLVGLLAELHPHLTFRQGCQDEEIVACVEGALLARASQLVVPMRARAVIEEGRRREKNPDLDEKEAAAWWLQDHDGPSLEESLAKNSDVGGIPEWHQWLLSSVRARRHAAALNWSVPLFDRKPRSALAEPLITWESQQPVIRRLVFVEPEKVLPEWTLRRAGVLAGGFGVVAAFEKDGKWAVVDCTWPAGDTFQRAYQQYGATSIRLIGIDESDARSVKARAVASITEVAFDKSMDVEAIAAACRTASSRPDAAGTEALLRKARDSDDVSVLLPSACMRHPEMAAKWLGSFLPAWLTAACRRMNDRDGGRPAGWLLAFSLSDDLWRTLEEAVVRLARIETSGNDVFVTIDTAQGPFRRFIVRRGSDLVKVPAIQRWELYAPSTRAPDEVARLERLAEKLVEKAIRKP